MEVSEHTMKSGIKRIAVGQRRSLSSNKDASAERVSSKGLAKLEEDANATRLHREAPRYCFDIFLFQRCFVHSTCR